VLCGGHLEVSASSRLGLYALLPAVESPTPPNPALEDLPHRLHHSRVLASIAGNWEMAVWNSSLRMIARTRLIDATPGVACGRQRNSLP